MPGLQPGSAQGLVPSHLVMRAFAALPAAGAWAVSDPQPTFSYSRLTLFNEYDQGAAGGIVDVVVEISPYSATAVVPALHNEWFPVTILGLENAVLGAIADGILEQLQFRFDPSTANQESFIIDISFPDYVERFRIQSRESGDTDNPGSFGATARLSIQDGAAEGLTRTVQTSTNAVITDITGFATVAGQELMADSFPVVIASDQSPIDVDVTGYVSSADAAAADVNAPAVNTAAVVTYGAVAGQRHYITGVAWSYYGGIPTAGNLTITDAGATVFNLDINEEGPGVFTFPITKRSAAVNTIMAITLTAAGAAVTGKLSILGHWSA